MTPEYTKSRPEQSISTHTSLAGRDGVIWQERLSISISTHTSLAGRDSQTPRCTIIFCDFYSHFLRQWCGRICPFLLTRPSRDVTNITDIPPRTLPFLLTRPSRDVTLFLHFYQFTVFISTHTSLAGRDILSNYDVLNIKNFYSHVPRGT